MKSVPHNHITYTYQCEICNTEYPYKPLALRCEEDHKRFTIGTKVIFSGVSHGSAMGHSEDYPYEERGIIVSTKENDYLIEFKNGTREWSSNINLELDKGQKIK